MRVTLFLRITLFGQKNKNAKNVHSACICSVCAALNLKILGSRNLPGFFRRLAFFQLRWYSIDNRRDATDRRFGPHKLIKK